MTTSDLVMVTPSQASTWLEDCNYERQRPIRRKHVDYLAEEMSRGLFIPGTAIHFVVRDGKTELVNGQHTLSAIAKSGKTIALTVVKVPTTLESGAADLYFRFDRHAKRTYSDMYNALDLVSEMGLTKTRIEELGAGVRLISEDFLNRSSNIHPDDLLEKMREYQEAMGWFDEARAGAERTVEISLRRRAVVSVALVTFRHSAQVMGNERVLDFWSGVAMDDGLQRGDPRKALVNHLRQHGMIGGGQASRAVSVGYQARYAANCFNAFAEERSLNFTKVLNPNSPIYIIHSPFAGS